MREFVGTNLAKPLYYSDICNLLSCIRFAVEKFRAKQPHHIKTNRVSEGHLVIPVIRDDEAFFLKSDETAALNILSSRTKMLKNLLSSNGVKAECISFSEDSRFPRFILPHAVFVIAPNLVDDFLGLYDTSIAGLAHVLSVINADDKIIKFMQSQFRQAATSQDKAVNGALIDLFTRQEVTIARDNKQLSQLWYVAEHRYRIARQILISKGIPKSEISYKKTKGDLRFDHSTTSIRYRLEVTEAGFECLKKAFAEPPTVTSIIFWTIFNAFKQCSLIEDDSLNELGFKPELGS